MNESYNISEFVACLKLGIWPGGEVGQLGYLSSLRLLSQGSANAGLWGVQVGFGVMLERSIMGDTGKTAMDFSVYDPYEGGYKLYRVMSGLTVAEAMNAIMDMASLSGEKMRWSSGVAGKSPYAFNRKYTAEYRSPRSGSIDTVGRKFGRQ